MIRDQYMLITDLPALPDGASVRLRGWIRTNRNNGHVGFIDLNDGSRFSGCQIVYDMDADAALKPASKYATGTAVDVTGTLVFTPDARQPFEVRAAIDRACRRLRQ